MPRVLTRNTHRLVRCCQSHHFPSAPAHSTLDEGHSYISEPPETPAPVFAVRAFKTALFGTPHPDFFERNHKEPLVQSKSTEEDKKAPQEESSPSNTRVISPNSKPLGTPMVKQDLFASPAKGILLTPGTGAVRRKTVSFGALIADGCGKSDLGKSVEVSGVTAGDASDLWDLRDCQSDQRGQTKLTKTLFKARNEIATQKRPVEAKESRPSISRERPGYDHEKVKDLKMVVEETIDLNKPSSRSGQHWKAEYEKYHEKSNREMRRIIRYSQVAKSYAAKKDTEAMDLGEKLRQQLIKVTTMEAKVAELAAQLATGISQGGDEASHTEKIVSELAEQTALAMRYKSKAEKYRATIRARAKVPASKAIDPLEPDSDELKTQASSGGNAVDRGETPHQLQEMTSLRDELAKIRHRVTAAEDKAARLENENSTLKNSLARVKESMGSYEIRRQAREEYHKQKEAKLEAQKMEYKQRLAQTQVELDHHKVPQSGGQRATTGRKDLLTEIDALSKYSRAGEAETDDDVAHNGRASRKWTEGPREPVQASMAAQDIESTSVKLKAKPAIDIWSVEDEGNVCMKDAAEAAAPPQHKGKRYDGELADDKATLALKEIAQNVVEGPALLRLAWPLDGPDTAIYLQETHDSMNSSLPPVLPSPEAPIPSASRRTQDRRATTNSPRPSIINFASSPFKQPSWGPGPQNAVTTSHRTAAAIDLALRRSVSGRFSSSRASSLRAALPPDRAAAAKARLEQRNAEKRRLQEKGKENARP